MSTYALSNAHPAGASHLGGLSGMFDEFTIARIDETADLDGARCLELGAGNGSIALWLATRVGPGGLVFAADIEPRHIPTHARVEILRTDLTRDPLPPGPFDLIHTRLVLGHLPNREQLLPQLCGMLARGGTILIEEFNLPAGFPGDEVLHAPAPELAELWDRYNHLRGTLFTEAGTDGTFTPRVHGMLVDAGLDPVETVTYCRSWRGGEPGSWHATGSLQQFRPKLVARGFTAADADALAHGLANPQLHIAGRLLNSTSGRRPLGG